MHKQNLKVNIACFINFLNIIMTCNIILYKNKKKAGSSIQKKKKNYIKTILITINNGALMHTQKLQVVVLILQNVLIIFL